VSEQLYFPFAKPTKPGQPVKIDNQFIIDTLKICADASTDLEFSAARFRSKLILEAVKKL
jgi:hypothetical protein